MKHFLLKYNYGVEIGARLAYLGHYKRVGDSAIADIAQDELEHRNVLEGILEALGHKPNRYINAAFTIIGGIISGCCSFAPIGLLSIIARLMEMFAVINYTKLAKLYPVYETTFLGMAQKEKEHGEYFAN